MCLGALTWMQYVLLRWFQLAAQLRLLGQASLELLNLAFLLVYKWQYHGLVFEDGIASDELLRVFVAVDVVVHVVRDRVLLVRLRHGSVQLMVAVFCHLLYWPKQTNDKK